jgi:hypothetical protein
MKDLSALIGHTVSIKNHRFPGGHKVRIASVIPGTRVMKAKYLFFSRVYVCESEVIGGVAARRTAK